MRLSEQFFYEKILSVQKRKSNQNQPTKTQTSEQKTTKATIFRAYKFLREENLVILCFDASCTFKIFSEKIK